MAIKGYIAEVTESEAGWGSRPDGHLICLDKEKGEAYATKDRGKVWSTEDGSEFSFASEFKLCILTEKGKELVECTTSGCLWTNNISDYVEEQ